MAKTLTETAVFTETCVVPEGDDSRDTAAEDVEALAQVLADRTRYFKTQLALLARTDAANTFAGIQTIPAGVTDPAIRFTGSPASGWRYITDAPIGAGQKLRLYYGDGNLGYCIVTINAVWNTTVWHQENATKVSYALQFNGGVTLGFWSKNAGRADWTDWEPADGGTFNAAGLTCQESLATTKAWAQTFESLSNIKAATDVESDTITVHANATVHGDVIATGNYTFAAVQGFTTPINLGQCAGASKLFSDGSVGLQESLSSQNEVAFAVHVPSGAKINQLRIRHAQATATPDSFTLRRRVHAFSGGVHTVDNSIYVTADATISSNKVTTLVASPPLALTVDASDELTLVWRLTDNGDVTALALNKIIALEIDWTRTKA